MQGPFIEFIPSKYLVVQQGGDEIVLTFYPSVDVTLGSPKRGIAARRVIRNLMKKDHASKTNVEDGATVVRLFDHSIDDVRETVRWIDDALDDMAREPLTGDMVEEALGISSKERLRWMKDGRLPKLNDAFIVGKRKVTFFVHPAAAIARLVEEPQIIAGWRHQDADKK
jgi:hypothetical protein